MEKYSAFTSTYPGIVSQLKSDAFVIYGKDKFKAIALWDTGATTTCISENVAQSLKLIPIGKTSIQTPSGQKVVNTYMVDVALPNGVIVQNVLVCDSDIGTQGIDLLIGMNIINLGEFCVSTYEKKTTFSLIIPPISEANFIPKAKTYNSLKGHKKKK